MEIEYEQHPREERIEQLVKIANSESSSIHDVKVYSVKIKNNDNKGITKRIVRRAAKNCVGSIFIDIKDPKDILTGDKTKKVKSIACWYLLEEHYAIIINPDDEYLLDIYR